MSSAPFAFMQGSSSPCLFRLASLDKISHRSIDSPMNKLKLHSKDLTAENIEKLAALFPNCLTETRDEETGEVKDGIDFDLLRQELSADLVEGPQERYRLDWPGKREALATANAPIAKTLRPCREESVDFESTQNLYIEGDNLDALKLLQETYLGKVKMIYIDPPYNTGNDFIYDDNFSMSREDYRGLSGEVDEEGNQMFDEEKWQQNSSVNGRFHSEWLSMVYPRLKLAKNLLTPDGVIFVSADDSEISNLLRLGFEVFGESCFVAQFIWKSRNFTDARATTKVSTDHEYVICFGRNTETRLRGKPRDESKYSNPDNDPRGPWMSRSILGLATAEQRPNLHYEIVDPSTKLAYPPSISSGWRYGKERMSDLISTGCILFPKSPDGRPREKKFRADIVDDFTSFPSIIDDVFTAEGTAEIQALFDSKLFDFPKPSSIVAKLIEQGMGQDDIILDFFSGSATTAHAVMKLNAEDGGTRRHIQVQLPEPCDEKSAAFKAGYATIAEIGKERIRRSGAKIREELAAQLEGELPGSEKHTEITAKLANLDTGFRVLKVDSSNMTADYYKRPDETTQEALALAVENIKPDRQPEDLLFQVMLDWGVELSLGIEKLELKSENAAGEPLTVYLVDGNALLACFDRGITDEASKEMAKMEPLRAVFRDASFKDDAARINVEQLFKTISPTTEVRAI